MSITRRDFVRTAAGAAGIGLTGGVVPMITAAQASSQPAAAKRPIVIASANGLSAVTKAMELLRQGGDPVDAVVAGVNLVEDDPNDHSVGLGGLPNEDGVVELDACVMHGPTHKGGAVAGLQNVRNAASVAKLVMWRTDHVLLVGQGALRFAKAHGFREEELLTEEARRIWLEWRESHSDRDKWLHPEADVEAERAKKKLSGGGAPPAGVELSRRADGTLFTWGTITCQALTAAGDLGGCTSTSGLSYKIPGRAGDSPILGAGLFVDNGVGSAGSTGRGEANLLNCSSFFIVEQMRAGMSPSEACLAALRRVAERCEPRLRNAQGEPDFGLTFYALRKDGEFGGAVFRGEAKMAVHDGEQARHVALPALYA